MNIIKFPGQYKKENSQMRISEKEKKALIEEFIEILDESDVSVTSAHSMKDAASKVVELALRRWNVNINK